MPSYSDHPATTPATTVAADAPMPVPALPAAQAALTTLPFAPRLIIWAARLWWQDRGNAQGGRPMLVHAFTLARCAGAAPAFDEVMLMVLHGACRHVDIGASPVPLASPRTAGMTRDEQALLGVIAAFQNGAVIYGEQALDAWLPPATARLACDPALVLARHLGQAGLCVQLPQLAPDSARRGRPHISDL